MRGGAIGGGAVLIAVVAALLGAPPGLVRSLLGGGGTTQEETSRQPTPAEEKAADFVKVVLGSTEDVWATVLPIEGPEYQPPRLVLFTDMVESACGIRELGGRAVLLPARSPRLPRPRILRRARSALRRAR